MKKKLVSAALFMIMVVAIFVANVHAITFINVFGSQTGEVIAIIPAHSGGYFVEIETENGVSRFYVSPDTYLQGGEISIGDTITGYHRSVGLSDFTGKVLIMTQTAPNQYDVLMEYTDTWIHTEDGTLTFHVDFNQSFLHERFVVGDTITAFYNPWAASHIFDMPHYDAVFVVNGDYDVYVGRLRDNRVSNLLNPFVSDDESVELNITDSTIVLTGSGEPFTGEIADHSYLAVVLNDSAIEKVVVISAYDETEITITAEPEIEWPMRFEPPILRLERPQIDLPVVLTEMPSSWAVEQVTAAIRIGLVPQNLQSNFTQAITRAEFATLAVNLYEYFKGTITGRSNFTDTNDEAVEKAAFIGIVSGIGNNRFDPNGTLTREQAAVMLTRLAEALVHNPVMMGGFRGFADRSEISSWAIDGVERVVTIGIMSGVGDNRFAPLASYTREQAIATIMRVYDLVNDHEWVHTADLDLDEPSVRVKIYTPNVPTASALEFIGEDEDFRYYLSSISSGIIMLTFEDGTEITLREALDEQMITIADVILNGLDMIISPRITAGGDYRR
ncbi:MAG: S-layer homology domain-containing protein [Defluviitaleaceae bacterium]|nr:S-layer homology domain-containing protein [Defluviitaleaceae bacterium]